MAFAQFSNKSGVHFSFDIPEALLVEPSKPGEGVTLRYETSGELIKTSKSPVRLSVPTDLDFILDITGASKTTLKGKFANVGLAVSLSATIDATEATFDSLSAKWLGMKSIKVGTGTKIISLE